MEHLKEYFNDESKFNETNSGQLCIYRNCLINEVGETKENYRERFQWIIEKIAPIEDIIKKVTDECFLSKLHKFATLTHTIGNLIILPKGYNKGRYNSTHDYFDLTLESLYYALGEKAFREYVETFFLEGYLCENKPVKFWEGHSFDKKEPENLKQVESYLCHIYKFIENREIDMLRKIEKDNCTMPPQI